MRFIVLLALLILPAAVHAQEGNATAEKTLSPQERPIPWVTVIRSGLGVDDNVDLTPDGSKTTALAGFELNSQLHLRPNLRLAVQATYQKNLPFTTAGDGEVGGFAGYMHELPAKLQLRLSALVVFRQERSVFADGAILQSRAIVQKILENDLAAVLVRRLGSVDLELGGQGNFEAHSGGGIEDSRLLGAHAMAAIRYSFRDRVALRARYTYEFSDTKGLSSRNLAGGIDDMGRALRLGLHRFRVSARTRITERSSAYARYDYVSAADDYSGYLDSHEHVVFAASTLSLESLTIEANAEMARRKFYLRTPSVENPDTDTTINAGVRIDAWVLPTFAGLRRLGLFALYRTDHVRADPTGLVFARQIGLSGVAGQFGREY